MAKATTVEELFHVLERAIHDGHGKARIYFDSEARRFNVHLVNIEAAHLEADLLGEPTLLLYDGQQMAGYWER